MLTVTQPSSTVNPSPATGNRAAVEATVSAIVARHPQLALVAPRAAEIVLSARIVPGNNMHQVRVLPARPGGEVYIVASAGRYAPEPCVTETCTCAAYRYRPITVGAHKYCKHIIAVSILRKMRSLEAQS